MALNHRTHFKYHVFKHSNTGFVQRLDDDEMVGAETKKKRKRVTLAEKTKNR
jgi:hypothetical protein